VNLESVDIIVLKNLERRIMAVASDDPELFCRQIKYASAQLPLSITQKLMEYADYIYMDSETCICK
jgi:predicted signal transduction protein with EAL and GGDEF domain